MIIMQAACDLTNFVDEFIIEILFTATLPKVNVGGNAVITVAEIEALQVWTFEAGFGAD